MLIGKRWRNNGSQRLNFRTIFLIVETVPSSPLDAHKEAADGVMSDSSGTAVTNHSPPETKITLFRSLFRGRDDVYPRRFENRKTGKSGYAPACGNEWIRGTCEKPRIKCSDCPNQRFLHVTDEVTRWHLSGRDPLGRDFVMGIYPMLLDETCFFVALDFDGSDWKKMQRPFSKPVGDSMCPSRWNGRGPVTARMCGSSSRKLFQRIWPANWVRTSSPRRWKRGRRSDLIRTIGFFPIRILYQQADSGI